MATAKAKGDPVLPQWDSEWLGDRPPKSLYPLPHHLRDDYESGRESTSSETSEMKRDKNGQAAFGWEKDTQDSDAGSGGSDIDLNAVQVSFSAHRKSTSSRMV